MTSQVFSEKKHGSETSNVYPSDKYQKGRILVSEVLQNPLV